MESPLYKSEKRAYKPDGSKARFLVCRRELIKSFAVQVGQRAEPLSQRQEAQAQQQLE